MDILKDKLVKTRKSQVCHGCAKSYERGTQMRYLVAVDQGDFCSTYYCETCLKVMEETWSADDLSNGVGYGDVKEFDVRYWESVRMRHQ